MGQARLTVGGLILAGVATVAAATAQADPQALSPFVPVTIEDAYPTATGKGEFQGVAYWDHGPRHGDLVTLAPELKLGAFPGAQFEIETPYALGSASARDQGSITFGGLYNLNAQRDLLPAFALHDDYAQGFGRRGGTSENTLKLIATKSLGDPWSAPRLHLNLSWIRATDAPAGVRTDRYQAAIGYSQSIADHTALVVDYVFAQNAMRGSNTNLIEAGLRHEVADNIAISAGAGAGIGHNSPDFRLLVALQYDFKAF
jgi:hypothetical protein